MPSLSGDNLIDWTNISVDMIILHSTQSYNGCLESVERNAGLIQPVFISHKCYDTECNNAILKHRYLYSLTSCSSNISMYYWFVIPFSSVYMGVGISFDD